MGSKANTWSTGLLNLLFVNTSFTDVGDAGGLLQSTTAGSLYISLHTADPGTGGSQTTNETAYTGYARVAVARSAGGWTVAGTSVSNTAVITFGVCTASPGSNITYAGIGTASAGAGKLLYRAALTSAVVMGVGVVPQFNATNLSGSES